MLEPGPGQSRKKRGQDSSGGDSTEVLELCIKGCIHDSRPSEIGHVKYMRNTSSDGEVSAYLSELNGVQPSG